LLYAETNLKIPASAFEPFNDTSSFDDGYSGIASTPEVSTNQGSWAFALGDLTPGVHSWFLVFSSNSAPVKGNFDVTLKADIPVPEPGTIALLGVASGCILANRRKKRHTA
jgi:hypothetical protein